MITILHLFKHKLMRIKFEPIAPIPLADYTWLGKCIQLVILLQTNIQFSNMSLSYKEALDVCKRFGKLCIAHSDAHGVDPLLSQRQARHL